MNSGPFPPISFPLRYHWNEGEIPPFLGAAVQVTVVPSHTETPGLAELLRAAPHKQKEIGRRAQVESDHHFYMCQESLGLVHSHRVKLA